MNFGTPNHLRRDFLLDGVNPKKTMNPINKGFLSIENVSFVSQNEDGDLVVIYKCGTVRVLKGANIPNFNQVAKDINSLYFRKTTQDERVEMLKAVKEWIKKMEK